jgi:hypothetical protein
MSSCEKWIPPSRVIVPEERQAADDFQDQTDQVYIKIEFDTPGKILIKLMNEDDSLYAEKHFKVDEGYVRFEEFKAQFQHPAGPCNEDCTMEQDDAAQGHAPEEDAAKGKSRQGDAQEDNAGEGQGIDV